MKHGIITVMYTLLTLYMFLQAEKLLLSQYNNIKMFVCTNFLHIRRCEYHLWQCKYWSQQNCAVMLFFSLCASFYHLGWGFFGVYHGNAICKIANSMSKISRHVWFSLKQGSVIMKTWISYIVMVLRVFVYVFVVLNALQWFFNALP